MEQFNASTERHRDYVNSALHRDHENELKTWLADIYQRLVAEQDHDEIMRFQGRAQAVLEMLEMPAKLLETLELEQRNG